MKMSQYRNIDIHTQLWFIIWNVTFEFPLVEITPHTAAGRQNTYVRSANGDVPVNGHHSQQTNTGHSKEDVKSCVDLEKNNNIT